MPPFLEPRDKGGKTIVDDKGLYPLNLKKTNYVFIDISLNIPNKVCLFLILTFYFIKKLKCISLI